MQQPDVVIAGAGVIGLSLALELRLRGRDVLVLDGNTPGLASRAAAGMLAAHDPHNPPALQPLANLALELYPAYLHQIRNGSGHAVPIQTGHVLEADPSGQPGHTLLPTLGASAGTFNLRPEQSFNPRDLHTALQAATQQAGVRLEAVDSNSGLLDMQEDVGAKGDRIPDSPRVPSEAKDETSSRTTNTVSFRPESARSLRGSSGFGACTETRISTSEREARARATQYIDCTGAWSPTHTRPSKGQMLRVELPPGTLQLTDRGNVVLRTRDIYLVPRLDGSTLIGATVEDAGFDVSVRDTDLDRLRARAAAILPVAAHAPELERWAGLRPRTADDLPILGELTPNHYVANGLFRNGILLAPAVAHVMAQLLTAEPTTIALDAFSPRRPGLTDR